MWELAQWFIGISPTDTGFWEQNHRDCHLLRLDEGMMKDWKKAIVSPEKTLREAIEIIDQASLRVVLVADAQSRLKGIVTDGDIRRALMKGLDLSTAISEVMTKQPKVAHADWSRARLLDCMEKHDLLQIPVVDPQGIILGLETLHGLLDRPRLENPVFLMAGGFGTRLRPLTDNCPKPMLKIGNKPILELILQGFIDAGCSSFYISTHYMPEQIKTHFGDGSRWGVEIQYIHEETPLGTAGALGLLPHDRINTPLFMMNGDLLTTTNFLSLLAFHEEHGGSATMCVRKHEYQVPYGVIQSEGHRITAIVEKPVQQFYINAGIYLLSPDLVKSVKKDVPIDMPTLLEQEISACRNVNLYPLHDYWLDIGRVEDFNRAQNEIGGLFDA